MFVVGYGPHVDHRRSTGGNEMSADVGVVDGEAGPREKWARRVDS